MQGAPRTFWGKLQRNRDGRVTYWHPLPDHCADVAAVAEGLLALPVWQRRLSRLAGQELTPTVRARLCVLAALHDIGKFNVGFQGKGCPHFGVTPAGHVREAIAALSQSIFRPLIVLKEWGPGTGDLLLSSLGHHGRPHAIDPSASTWKDHLWQARPGFDPRAGLEDLLSRCQRWYPLAFEHGRDPLQGSAAFTHAFAGLVMLADWIGSNSEFFPFTAEDDRDDRIVFARRRVCEAFAHTHLGLDIPLVGRRDHAQRDAFARVASAHCLPRPAQRAILTVPHDANGSIVVLEAETGSGKTEAALARFIDLFEAGLVDGLYFALPTRSAATEIHRRVFDAVGRALHPAPAVTLAVPGYFKVDDWEGYKESKFDVFWPEIDDPRRLYRTWAAENAKRYLTGSIVVGTIDQVLLSSLMVNHAHLRSTSLLRHLLVVDEVHASDAYMGRVLEHVLARHRSAGGHALLLSATLGAELRTRVLSPGVRTQAPGLSDASATPYPLISYRGAEHRTVAIDGGTAERAVSVTAIRMLEDSAALAREVVTAAQRGAKVLVIRNTVSGCLATQKAVEAEAAARGCSDLLLRCEGHAVPHHSRYAAVDRRALDRALEQRLGANRPDGGCIVVATQTVQQSLDLDADVLYTDLCPADVLLQRIGRLHRHIRERPHGFEQPHVFVLVPATRDLGLLIRDGGDARGPHGIGTVYVDLRILESTWRLIETHATWRIPAMNRHLVEHSLHSTVLADVVIRGDARWQAHALALKGTQIAHTRLAELNVIDVTRSYGSTEFLENVHIPTRLGQSDLCVRLRDTPVTSPFGNDLTEFTLKLYWISPVASTDEFAETLRKSSEGITFQFAGHVFTYDRLGLRPQAIAMDESDLDDGP